MPSPDGDLLHVEGLVTEFGTGDGAIRPVDGVSLSVGRGECVAVVGESGCGKSLTALSIMRLVPPPGQVVAGNVRFEQRELLALPEHQMRRLRGGRMAMIFQEPAGSLNPVFTAGQQIVESIELHRRVRGKAARELTVALLARVGIPAPEQRFGAYPHELSGGMCQRVMIAVALAGEPALLIADEPTTALDVTIQAEILELLDRLQQRMGMAVLLITHNLGIVAERTRRVYVMYAGQIVEEAPTARLFAVPAHPYTAGLLAAIPRLDEPRPRLAAIPGQVPAASAWPAGCRFHPRCPHAWERCRGEMPPLLPVADGHRARCWLVEEPDRRRRER
jgi:oligopeptide/dipeptide ABC transporter ATP-binding protein